MKNIKVIVGFLIILSTITICGCTSRETITKDAKEQAIKAVRSELLSNGHPIGMFDVSWHMTQQEVRQVLGSCTQLDNDTLVQDRVFYSRPIKASFHFTDNSLLVIVVSFKDNFTDINEYGKAFYVVQEKLTADYGQMTEPAMNEIVSPVNGKWTDQKLIESKKSMGRTNLTHVVNIKNDSLGEQIIMYLN